MKGFLIAFIAAALQIFSLLFAFSGGGLAEQDKHNNAAFCILVSIAFAVFAGCLLLVGL